MYRFFFESSLPLEDFRERIKVTHKSLKNTMGAGNIFSGGGALGDFFKNFLGGGQKWWNLFFPTSK